MDRDGSRCLHLRCAIAHGQERDSIPQDVLNKPALGERHAGAAPDDDVIQQAYVDFNLLQCERNYL